MAEEGLPLLLFTGFLGLNPTRAGGRGAPQPPATVSGSAHTDYSRFAKRLATANRIFCRRGLIRDNALENNSN